MFWRQMANESIREMLSDTPQTPSDAKVDNVDLPLGRCFFFPTLKFLTSIQRVSSCGSNAGSVHVLHNPSAFEKQVRFGLIRECVYHHVCHIDFTLEAPSLASRWMYMCFHFAPERRGSTSDNTQEQEHGKQHSPPRVSALTTALEHAVQSATGGGKEGGEQRFRREN